MTHSSPEPLENNPPPIPNAESAARLERMVEDFKEREEKKRREQQAVHGANQTAKAETEAELLSLFRIVPNEEFVLSDDEKDAMQAEEQRKKRWGYWSAICPARYREEFRQELCKSPKAKVDVVLGWQYGEKGLYVIGASGGSKSRAVGAALGRAFMAGRTVHYVDGNQFSCEATEHSRDSKGMNAWKRTLLQPDILWIDDFAKRWTPATEEAAFMIIEGRTAWQKPVVITTNYSRKQMEAKAGDMAVLGPLLRRLKDYCTVVSFDFDSEE